MRAGGGESETTVLTTVCHQVLRTLGRLKEVRSGGYVRYVLV
jgi:hypothetical protein